MHGVHSNFDVSFLSISRKAAYTAILLSSFIMLLLRASSASTQEFLVRFPVGFASTGLSGPRFGSILDQNGGSKTVLFFGPPFGSPFGPA